jgi:DNA-binding LytR/AlgR family response regulator
MHISHQRWSNGTCARIPVQTGWSMLRVLKAPKVKEPATEKIVLRSVDAIHVIDAHQITHCEAHDNYCRIHFRDGHSIFLAKTLKCVQQLLPASAFFRIHRTHVVRLNDIIRVSKDHIELCSGAILPVARSKRTALLHQIQ